MLKPPNLFPFRLRLDLNFGFWMWITNALICGIASRSQETLPKSQDEILLIFFSYTLNIGVNSRSVQRQTCPIRINISTSRRPCPSFLWMLQFYSGSQLCLSWAVCPSFPKKTRRIDKVPIISSYCSILPMTKISLNTCTSLWEMEVAIGKEITATILTRDWTAKHHASNS